MALARLVSDTLHEVACRGLVQITFKRDCRRLHKIEQARPIPTFAHLSSRKLDSEIGEFVIALIEQFLLSEIPLIVLFREVLDQRHTALVYSNDLSVMSSFRRQFFTLDAGAARTQQEDARARRAHKSMGSPHRIMFMSVEDRADSQTAEFLKGNSSMVE